MKRRRRHRQRQKADDDRQHPNPASNLGRKAELPHQRDLLGDRAWPRLQHAGALGLQHELIKVAQGGTFPLHDQGTQGLRHGGRLVEGEERSQLQPVDRQVSAGVEGFDGEPPVRICPFGNVRIQL